MSETLTNGVIVPDKGSRDWYADLRSNWLKLDSLMAGGNITVNPAQTNGILVATITVGGKEYKLYQQDGDVSVKIDPSAENAEYPLVASTSAEANTGSVVMAPAVTVNPSTGAVTATSFKGKLDGNASTATNATKAVQDGAGAVITDTYATKKELGSKADDDNVVHKSGAETIVGTKTFSSQIKGNISGTSSDVVVGSDTATARGYLVDGDLPRYTWEEGSPLIAGRIPLITDFNNLSKPGVYHVVFCCNDGYVHEEKEYKESLNRPSIPNITTGFRDGILEIKETTTMYNISSFRRYTQKLTLLSGNSNHSFNGRTYQRVCLNISDNAWTAWKRVAIDEEVVHNTGSETIAGVKTFSNVTYSNKELRYQDTKYDWTNTSLDTWCDAGHVSWSDKTGNRRMHELVGTKGGVWRKACYINENPYFAVNSNRDITYWGTTTFYGEVQTNTIKAVGGGANISLTASDNGGFAIRAFNGTTNKELVGYPNGMLAWDNNEILTRVNGVTVDTEQTITGAKTFLPWTTFSSGLNVRWITGNKEQKSLFLFASMTDNYRGYGAELQLHTETLNGGFNLIAKDKTGTNIKFLAGDSNGSLTWNNANILTDANQIMVLKNLTGNRIASGAVIDCGTGNGLLAGWFIDAAGGWALANNKITGKWKNVSIYNIENTHSAMFVKVG